MNRPWWLSWLTRQCHGVLTNPKVEGSNPGVIYFRVIEFICARTRTRSMPMRKFSRMRTKPRFSVVGCMESPNLWNGLPSQQRNFPYSGAKSKLCNCGSFPWSPLYGRLPSKSKIAQQEQDCPARPRLPNVWGTFFGMDRWKPLQRWLPILQKMKPSMFLKWYRKYMFYNL